MSITLFIIIATALVSITAFQHSMAFERMKFNAYEIRRKQQFYRFFSYGLLHIDYMHLFVNMFVLFSFGSNVEALFTHHFGDPGRLFFIILYAGGLIISVIPAYLKHINHPHYNAVGASGAVSAILFASILMYPQGSVMFIFFPVPIPAFIFGILYLLYSAYMAKRGSDNVGHDVHFWGAIFGVIFPALLDPSLVSRFFEYVF
ncbi:MAG: rhomboid family intramembrane serine protease [Bacteroidales bacterium]